MSVSNAKKFINRIQTDRELRNRLNRAASSLEISEILKNEDLSFSEENFVEGSSYLLANSPSPERTEELRELYRWWDIISGN